MSECKKVKIGEFLKQYRNTIYVDDAQQYRQVTISSKDGVKYRCTKIGKEIGRKRQFLIDLKKYPNTVIFTRQGLYEGSIGLAPEEVDGCIATENMPMFSVDESIIDTEYLKNLLRSPIFANLVSSLTPTGSAQKSIHERDLLPLEISIPDLQTQKKIVKEISSQLDKTEQLSIEIAKQKSYAKQLRQNILQEAIEGKLTENWRKGNPVVKGNPDFDAEALFEKIQEEKCHTDSELLRNSKRKVFETIAENELPFEIPEGWKWVKLEHLAEVGTGATPLTSEKKYYENGTIPWITSSSTGNDFVSKADVFITEIALKETNCSLNPKGTLVVAMYGQGKTRGQITELCIEAATNQACATIKIFEKDNVVLKKYIKFVFKKMYEEIRSLAQGGTQPNLNLGKIANTIFPLPPLAEQKEIVARVEQHLQTITQLETQIATRETTTKQLMQSILKDAFEEK